MVIDNGSGALAVERPLPVFVETALVPSTPGVLARVGDGLAKGVLLSAGAVVGAQIALRVDAHLQPHPMPHQMASLLDSPLRLRYRSPDDALGLYGIEAGMQTLDLGCGTGLFTEELGRMVGPTGMVHGVDIQSAMVEATRTRMLDAGLADRGALHHAGAYSLPLDDGSVDVAILIATLGEIPDRLHALLELQRVIRPGGRLAISEEMPHPAYMTAGSVRRFAAEAGFIFMGKTGTPFCYHLIFTRP
jgi:SAM-dependent methyltransferase